MTMPKKNSRGISVDGVLYRFLVKKGYSELNVVIQEDVKDAGNVLRFRTDADVSITPGLIAAVIKNAISSGWVPNKKGAAFHYTPPQEIVQKTYGYVELL